MSSEDNYPTIRLRRTESGYETRDGKYRVIRDTFSDIGSSNAGCYKPCFHVYSVDADGNESPVMRFCQTLAEARVEIVCDIEKHQSESRAES